MREISVDLGDRAYTIQVGRDLLAAPDALIGQIRGRMVAVVSDANVAPLHAQPLAARLRPHAAALESVVLPAGEAHKQWDTLGPVFDLLLGARFDRDAVVVAVGGGVVGDMAGFAAAIYQRGIDVIQVPTTLLAQVDSSVGGKTGINHPLGKNMIGAFHQPRAVLIDVETLQTLPDRELSAGLAEVIKHGAVADRAYFDAVVAAMPALRARDPSALIEAVACSCEIKADVVGRDEREGGLRAILNFGHTFGHAIEAGLGYGEWLHGEAVGAGMVMAADLSVRLGRLDPADAERLRAAVAAAGLPTRGPAWPVARYIALMSVDKKARQGIPRFVLLDGLGRAVVTGVPEAQLAATLAACAA